MTANTEPADAGTRQPDAASLRALEAAHRAKIASLLDRRHDLLRAKYAGSDEDAQWQLGLTNDALQQERERLAEVSELLSTMPLDGTASPADSALGGATVIDPTRPLNLAEIAHAREQLQLFSRQWRMLKCADDALQAISSYASVAGRHADLFAQCEARERDLDGLKAEIDAARTEREALRAEVKELGAMIQERRAAADREHGERARQQREEIEQLKRQHAEVEAGIAELREQLGRGAGMRAAS